jgi:TRAP-type uncharacterized transport system fused permease subunit
MGVVFFSSAVQGYLGHPINIPGRLLFAAAGLPLLKPGLWTDLLGLVLALVAWGIRSKTYSARRKKTQAQKSIG